MPDVVTVGLSMRKRRILRSFLPDCRLSAVAGAGAIRAGMTVAVWASDPRSAEIERLPDVRVLRIEDGFLRSVGLGARLARPLSWVVDSQGIYYDPSRPSELETLLQSGAFDEALLARAKRLRERIVASSVSKYNVGARNWAGLSGTRDPARPVVLVAGQVETDASLQAASPRVRTNMDLIRAARACHPDAWLVYKPHPDVVAGLRHSGRGEALTLAAGHPDCNEIVTDAPVAALLDTVDTVHVMSSQTGFEALLRGRTVHCHGLPFYAGWGLTHDAMPAPRRTRRLALDELVAATLILYPRYVRRATGTACTPEEALEDLIDWKLTRPAVPRWWHGLTAPFLRHE